MKTYHCHKCDQKYRRDPKKMRATDKGAWCYCEPQTPTRLSDVTRKALDRKYGHIFKGAASLGALGGMSTSEAKRTAARLNGKKGGHKTNHATQTTDVIPPTVNGESPSTVE